MPQRGAIMVKLSYDRGFGEQWEDLLVTYLLTRIADFEAEA